MLAYDCVITSTSFRYLAIAQPYWTSIELGCIFPLNAGSSANLNEGLCILGIENRIFNNYQRATALTMFLDN